MKFQVLTAAACTLFLSLATEGVAGDVSTPGGGNAAPQSIQIGSAINASIIAFQPPSGRVGVGVGGNSLGAGGSGTTGGSQGFGGSVQVQGVLQNPGTKQVVRTMLGQFGG